MLCGRQAFEGENVSDTLAAVLRGEPDWTLLPDDLPPAIRTLLHRVVCRKDRTQRLADISTAHFLLTEPAGFAATGVRAIAPRLPFRRRVLAPAVWLLVGGLVAGTTVWLAMRPLVPSAPRVSRLHITPPSVAALNINSTIRNVAITSDGTRVIYSGASGTALVVRALDQLDVTSLTGLGTPYGPFVSPDGQWIGFADATVLKKVAITGGPAMTLASLDGSLRGATWAPDGTIVYATTNTTTGLQRIAPGGGEPAVLTRPDPTHGEVDHCLAGAPTGGPSRAVYDHGDDGRPRPGAGRGLRPPDRDANDANPRRQRRTLRAERASRVRRGR